MSRRWRRRLREILAATAPHPCDVCSAAHRAFDAGALDGPPTLWKPLTLHPAITGAPSGWSRYSDPHRGLFFCTRCGHLWLLDFEQYEGRHELLPLPDRLLDGVRFSGRLEDVWPLLAHTGSGRRLITDFFAFATYDVGDAARAVVRGLDDERLTRDQTIWRLADLHAVLSNPGATAGPVSVPDLGPLIRLARRSGSGDDALVDALTAVIHAMFPPAFGEGADRVSTSAGERATLIACARDRRAEDAGRKGRS